MWLAGPLSQPGRFTATAVFVVLGSEVLAFPPYRSTDADTADPYLMQVRLGIIDLDYHKGDSDVTSPMIHANLGLPHEIEVTSELEYAPASGEIAEGAVGLKWIPLAGKELSLGMEALALLPVRAGDSGTGLEFKLIGTWWREDMHLHLNAGGFNDTRTSPAEDGWETSLLAEFPRGSYRPGIEISAQQISGEPTEVSAGIGSIFEKERFAVRVGVHVGVTEQAPDLEINLWITTQFPLRR